MIKLVFALCVMHSLCSHLFKSSPADVFPVSYGILSYKIHNLNNIIEGKKNHHKCFEIIKKSNEKYEHNHNFIKFDDSINMGCMRSVDQIPPDICTLSDKLRKVSCL